MKYYLGLPHSHAFWMRYGACNKSSSTRTVCDKQNHSAVEIVRSRPAAHSIPNAKKLSKLEMSGMTESEFDLELIIPDAQSRGKANQVTYRIWNGPESGTFAKISSHCFIATPPACYCMLAQSLSKESASTQNKVLLLAEYGCMLCGTYAFNSATGEMTYGISPLTSKTALGRYLERTQRFRGKALAAKALKIIVDNSASPMESKLAIALSAPASLGGSALPSPTMNKKIEIPPSLTHAIRKSHYCCDLFWPGKPAVVLEYDSMQFHTGKERIAQDTLRRNNLSELGLKIIGATQTQVGSIENLDNLTRLVAKSIGARKRISRDGYAACRLLLWRHLFRRSARESFRFGSLVP